jgi:hypothetical protein
MENSPYERDPPERRLLLSAATVVIEGEGNRVEAPASIYLGNLAASWQTWVLEHTGTGWEVTGTTGPVSIS